jgi:hypothetical protein
MRKYHPDVIGDSGADMTVRLNQVCDELLDPLRRAAYDRGLVFASERVSASSADSREPASADATWVTPSTGAPPTARKFAWSSTRYRTWASVRYAAGAVILVATLVVFAWSYSVAFTLTSPRAIPPIVVATAWIVAAQRRPSALLSSLLVIGGSLWPVSLMPLATGIGFGLPDAVLALLTVAAIAVVALRISLANVSDVHSVRRAAFTR